MDGDLSLPLPAAKRPRMSFPVILEQDSALRGLMKHALFSGAVPLAEVPDQAESAAELSGFRGIFDHSASASACGPWVEAVAAAEVEVEAVEVEDLLHPLPQYDDTVEPRDRVRWASYLPRTGDEGSTSTVGAGGAVSAVGVGDAGCAEGAEGVKGVEGLERKEGVGNEAAGCVEERHVQVRVTGGWMKKLPVAPNDEAPLPPESKPESKLEQVPGPEPPAEPVPNTETEQQPEHAGHGPGQEQEPAPASDQTENDSAMQVATDAPPAATPDEEAPPADNPDPLVPPIVILSSAELRERVRSRAADMKIQQTMSVDEPTLNGRYKRKLLEAVASSALPSTGFKNKRKAPSWDTGSALSYGRSPDAPLLFYVPMDDGGLRAVCVSVAPQPPSLHDLCTTGQVCAYCFAPFAPDMKLYSDAQIAAMIKRRKKSKTQRKRKSADEDDSDDDGAESVKFLVAKTVGAVTFTLHRQCAYAADNGGAYMVGKDASSAAAALPVSVGNEGEGGDEDTHIDEEGQESEKDEALHLPGLEIGPLYDCDEADDSECDLCGRSGGILQFFDVDPLHSSLPPPGEEGWLAHAPCLAWLVKSRLLELPPEEGAGRGKSLVTAVQPEAPASVASVASVAPLVSVASVAPSVSEASATGLIAAGEPGGTDVETSAEVDAPSAVDPVVVPVAEEAEKVGSSATEVDSEPHALLCDTDNGRRVRQEQGQGQWVGHEQEHEQERGPEPAQESGQEQKQEHEVEVGVQEERLVDFDGDAGVERGNTADGQEPRPHGPEEGLDEDEETNPVRIDGEDADGGKELEDEQEQVQEQGPVATAEQEEAQEEEEEAPSEKERPPLSLFDVLLSPRRQWRCAFCGGHAGLTVRCAAPSCAVRSHPLCAILARHQTTPGTSTATFAVRVACHAGVDASEGDQNKATVCYLCPLHASCRQMSDNLGTSL